MIIRNLTEDLTERCRKAVEAFLPIALDMQEPLDVTCILMAASLGFVVPYDVLTKRKDDDKSRQVLAGISAPDATLDGLLTQNFNSSRFGPSHSLSVPPPPTIKRYFEGENGLEHKRTWQFGKVGYDASSEEPNSWEDLGTQGLKADTKVRKVLDIFRNALAHGNIRTIGNTYIDELVFLSFQDYREQKKGYNYIKLPPSEFLLFLLRWFEFLETDDVKVQLVASSPGYDAAA